MARPYLRTSQPMPPPSVSPAMPTEPGVAERRREPVGRGGHVAPSWFSQKFGDLHRFVGFPWPHAGAAPLANVFRSRACPAQCGAVDGGDLGSSQQHPPPPTVSRNFRRVFRDESVRELSRWSPWYTCAKTMTGKDPGCFDCAKVARPKFRGTGVGTGEIDETGLRCRYSWQCPGSRPKARERRRA